ncbi:MAG: nuclease [Confluentimicrobium sp.]|nr:nuclease [Actibacterium sp.]
MAKRRRLTPPRADFLPSAAEPAAGAAPEAPGPLETKTMFRLNPNPVPPPNPVPNPAPRSRAPIADVAGETSASAALSELSQEVAQRRAEGRMVERLPLLQVDAAHLVRDRLTADAEELQALTDSLRDRGQQTPIEVVDRGESARPRYGLIAGWRRMAALLQLSGEAGEAPQDATVLAVIRSPKTASDAYLAMVEENEIRADLSYYERARIVLKSVEQGVHLSQKEALTTLFKHVSRAKRSKIKSFVPVVAALDGVLRFPTALSEKAGLDLARYLAADQGHAARLITRLQDAAPASAEEELALIAAETGSPAMAPAADPDIPVETVPVTGVSVSNPPAPPRQPAAPRAQNRETESRAAVHADFEPDHGIIRLSGPGVDAAFLLDLEHWLVRRR